ncbi:MAG: tol-pal system protein YbgF [Proteobacteria bacterium]|nr:tol-pal system protein YbgF [Pseudomonadota bacterium]
MKTKDTQWAALKQGPRVRGFEGSRVRSPLSALRYVICVSLLFGFFGCTSTDELTRLQQSVNSLNIEFNRYKAETDGKLSTLSKDNQTLGKQIINISTSDDNRENNTKIMLGKLDELEHQLQVYWNETKTEINALKKSGLKPQAHSPIAPVPQSVDDANYEASYREAFDTFQKGFYEESIAKFTHFIAKYSKTPLAPNAYFWLGESYMNLKNYDNAILNFQEVCDKYPKSDKVPRALLSQAEAFSYLKDKKSSTTIFKKVIELFPKSEEAIIADRKLRNLSH